ncbi:MAG: 50S ribosomal protein L9 [Erysipelotrichaceae bacterium]|nr:50S ribosomal protein L9 [Erysipelotrichaceae bacterium]
MKVILLNDVKKVGKKGDVVEVADGYARNFLIAKGYAVQETTTSKKILEIQKGEEAENQAELKKEAENLKNKLENLVVEFKVRSGKEGKVFGSISTKQIVEELSKMGIKVDKRKFIDTTPINVLGTTIVKVELYKGVVGNIKCHLSEME